ncbi:MAG: sensor histidine kinase [Dissulfurispiraceae bacterium]|jgi:two-component system, OmpR family, sensor histidine kinase BaeS
MRTKLFIAFIIITVAALLSTIAFKSLILKDFDNYVTGVKEDQIYWIIASVEGAYMDGVWDRQKLAESTHWAMMMGFDIKIVETGGMEVVHSHNVMESLSPGMKQRMADLFRLDMTLERKYDEFPINSNGTRIGTLLARSFQKKQLAEKEAIFESRVTHFLYVYLLIAGLGLVFIALLLSQYLSKPLLRLKKASEKVAGGDFSVRIESASSDEVGDLAKTFNRMAESLQKEEGLRKRLMSNVAHELRTPLTIMKTHVEAMADGIVSDTSKGLVNIEHEIGRLIELVKGIEDITAAEASFFAKRESSEINLKDLLSGLRQDLLPSFQSRELYIKILKESDLHVTSDIEKLERILRNILSNALKFTDVGGVSIDFGTDANSFFIEVKDTGRGIPEKELPFIFNRFYRSEESRVEGLGLGLAIVKELMEVMGGNITVKSIVGEGTSVRISLPLKA